MPSDVLSPDGSLNAMVQDDESGLTSCYEDPDQPQDPQDMVVPLHPEMPTDAAPTGSNRTRRCPSKVCTARGQCVLAGTVILMLIFAIAGLSAVHRQKAAPVLACPYEWVGYRNVCYYLSGQQKLGSWNWSQEQCTTHGASLAMVMRDWELNFLRQLKDSADSWLGLRRRGERLLWVDGSSFKETFTVQGGAECVYLNGEDVATSSCWQSRPYICSKALAVGAAPENGGGETTFPVLDTGGSSH
ncbi:C-type lectin domain family 2 member D-like isoform X1 [Cygnus olor]|uniref:C-type lectin domain family 2 member D-like isoform X1 n=1 Tax=Cygnus olor TaxID=8869 RepID=UPI001ADE8769|nr:C-type lectin domain family 2 member D-like isoform X1 [Cygnus olor]XP_040398802.1 C-type lectin domain family 2 member D-like isoform X1 [Cygnus olor]